MEPCLLNGTREYMFGGRYKMNDSAYLSFELLRHDRRLGLETGLEIGHELLKLILFCVSVVLTQLKGKNTQVCFMAVTSKGIWFCHKDHHTQHFNL